MDYGRIHNEVNSRVGNPILSENILEIYKTYNIRKVYNIFLKVFFTSYYSGTDMTNIIVKSKCKKLIVNFFNKHKNKVFNG